METETETEEMITRHEADKLLAAEGLGSHPGFDRECWDKYAESDGTIFAGFVHYWIEIEQTNTEVSDG
tara:strand:+ start:82 stop:285 length:204 start_codon:yes stop_codon:yes gene_type:complete